MVNSFFDIIHISDDASCRNAEAFAENIVQSQPRQKSRGKDHLVFTQTDAPAGFEKIAENQGEYSQHTQRHQKAPKPSEDTAPETHLYIADDQLPQQIGIC